MSDQSEQNLKQAADARVTKEQIIEVLKTIIDPEVLLDIWFLGLIYTINIKEPSQDKSDVYIEMTFTTPMCPAGPDLMDQVRTKVGAINGVSAVDLKLTFNPPWQPSDEVKGLLGMM